MSFAESGRFLRVFAGEQSFFLYAAYLALRCGRRKYILAQTDFLHTCGYKPAAVVRIVYSEAVVIAQQMYMPAEYPYADAVERTCPYGVRPLPERSPQSRLEFVCRLVGKSDAQHRTGIRRIDREPAQIFRDLSVVAVLVQIPHIIGVGGIGNVIRPVRVPVIHNVRYTVNQHGGLAAPRSRKYEQRAVYCEQSLALPVVKAAVQPCEQFSLCFGNRHVCASNPFNTLLYNTGTQKSTAFSFPAR